MLPEGFQIDPNTYRALMSTIEKDCLLLESNGNMDYSLLLGVHIVKTHSTPPGGIPAINNKGERILIFVGIIDILQYYRLSKKIEHTFKSVISDGVSDWRYNLLFSGHSTCVRVSVFVFVFSVSENMI